MQPRIDNPVIAVPGAMAALQRLSAVAAQHADVPEATRLFVALRASQINGCSVCCDMHSRELKALGEPDERIFTLAAWREASYFSDAERAALALTEAATRLADRSDAVSDEVWDEAARHSTSPAGVARAGDRLDQRLEPDQRDHPADHRGMGHSVDPGRRAIRLSRLTGRPRGADLDLGVCADPAASGE